LARPLQFAPKSESITVADKRKLLFGNCYWTTKLHCGRELYTYLKLRFLKWKCTSTMPVVLTRVRSISCSVGM